ncbi:hypothetical protein ACJX0J_036164, partial [Zea mays]
MKEGKLLNQLQFGKCSIQELSCKTNQPGYASQKYHNMRHTQRINHICQITCNSDKEFRVGMLIPVKNIQKNCFVAIGSLPKDLLGYEAWERTNISGPRGRIPNATSYDIYKNHN